MTIKLTTILSSAALALVLAGCGGEGTDGKDAKSKTAKKDVKGDAKAKRDDKKLDKKLDDKKADDKKADDEPPPTTAGDEPPPDDKAAATELSDEKVVEVAKVAKDIEAKPADADSILEKAGMDRAQFDTAMASIAKDQWKSDLYIAAFTADAKG
jgi:hypothetical protein